MRSRAPLHKSTKSSGGTGSYLANSVSHVFGPIAEERPQSSLGDHETEPHGTGGDALNGSNLATRKIFEVPQYDDVAQIFR